MKSKKNFVFLLFNLILMVGFLQLYSFFKDYFSDANVYIAQKKNLEEEIEREKLRRTLLENQLLDFREQVASHVPTKAQKLTKLENYKLTQLTQTVRAPAAVQNIDLSSMLMAKAKNEFREHKLEQAAKTFQEVINKYPLSAQVIEAHFLLGETYFQNKKYEDCLDVINDMMTQFPQNEMTGYLMLRNADILKIQKRDHEAAEVYKIVAKNFSFNKALKIQARKLASEK